MTLQSPQLEAFMAIVKHKTVHAAADAIALTQTAVTQRILGLEHQLKTTLFIRSRRGMQLTPEGEALLRYCEAAKELEGEAMAKIQGHHDSTTVTITITGPITLMRSRIIPHCTPVIKKHNNLLIKFNIDDSDQRINKLRTGDAQLAIVKDGLVAREMESKLLSVEEYVLVCTKAWQDRSIEDILQNERIIDFDEEDDMTFAYLKAFNLQKNEQHDRHFVNDTRAMISMIIDGVGYGVLTKEFCNKYIRNGDLLMLNQGKPYHHTVLLAWYPRAQAPAYFQDLIDVIQ